LRRKYAPNDGWRSGCRILEEGGGGIYIFINIPIGILVVTGALRYMRFHETRAAEFCEGRPLPERGKDSRRGWERARARQAQAIARKTATPSRSSNR
jgi:hypothetical protein